MPPFDPHINYPEYSGSQLSDLPNYAYDGVRNSFILLELDKDNIGTDKWNPLGEIIKPGETVFIKPNFVDHKHRFNGELWSVITHPSVLRAVCDYVAIALQGKGKILIGDNPHVDAKFNIIRDVCALDQLQSIYTDHYGLECEILDLRFYHTPDLSYYGFKEGRVKLPGDPKGSVKVNLGKNSKLQGVSPLLLRGTYTDRKETIKHHVFGKHEYFFSKSIYDADVYISIPKLKSHAKVGVTLNIKGLIGTIANKNSLVHWRIGYPILGGDEYPTPRLKRDYFKLYLQHLLIDIIPSNIYFSLRNFFNKTKIGKIYNKYIQTEFQKQKILRGAWDGNDTIWRMTVDVYNSFFKQYGKIRKTFSVIDGIKSGERNGPHFPEGKNTNCIISGFSLLETDVIATRLMDFDIEQIRYINELLHEYKINANQIEVSSNMRFPGNFFSSDNSYLSLQPPDRWPKLSICHSQSPIKDIF